MRQVHLALGAILLAAGLSNLIWLALDQRPSAWDQARYLLMTRDVANRIGDAHPSLLRLAFLGNHETHPHLIPALAAIPYLVSGRNVDGAYSLNTLFFLGTALLVFFISQDLCGRREALLGACAILAMPLFGRFSRIFSLELGASFFVTLAFLCLLRSRRFASTPWTLAWGVACSAALLAKWTTAVFLLGPFCVQVVRILGIPKAALAIRLARVLLAILVAALLVLPWYWSRRVVLQQFVGSHREGGMWASNAEELGGIRYYLVSFVGEAGWIMALICGGGLFLFLIRRRPEVLSVGAWVILPLLVFAYLIPTQNPRHLLPAYPALALAVGSSLAAWRFKRTRVIVIGLVGALFLVSFCQSSWGFRRERRELFRLLPVGKRPMRESWRLDEILDTVAKDWDARGGSRKARVLIVPGNFPFQWSGFAYLAAEEFPEVELMRVLPFVPPSRPAHRHPNAFRMFDSDYWLMRRGDFNGGEMHRYAYAAKRFLESDQRRGGRLFQRIATLRLPGGVAADIYRLRRTPDEAAVLDGLDWLHELDPCDPTIAYYLDEHIKTGVLSSGRKLLALTDSSVAPASRVLEDAVDSLPELRWVRRLLAESHVINGNFSAAARLFRGLGRGTAYSTSPFESAGDCMVQMGGVHGAQAAYREAVDDFPESVSARRKLGDNEGAQVLERMQAFKPVRETVKFRLRLGDLAVEKGRFLEARYHYSVALENVPAHLVVQARLKELAIVETIR